MEIKHDSSSDPQRPTKSESSSRTGATGPRSPGGKQKSSRNAIRHGVFTNSVLLPGESSNHYRSRVRALREDFPAAAEEILLETFAALSWRQARLFRVEAQEICRATQINERFQELVNVLNSPEIESPQEGLEHSASNEPLRTPQTQAILPRPDILENFMRYEKHLVRLIDNVLDQIVRIRGMKKGCPMHAPRKRTSLRSESRKPPQKKSGDQ
jgi:hypothetical protein